MKKTLNWLAPALLLINSLEADTVLIFEPSDELTLVRDSYGDRVSSSTDAFGDLYAPGSGGTTNVTVEYGPVGSQVRQSPGPYGALANVACQEDGDFGLLEIRLTADSGFQVALRHFDLAAQGDDVLLSRVEVLGGNGATLHAQDDVFVPGFIGRTRFDFTSLPLVAGSILIRIDLSALENTDSHLIGIDNVGFAQVPGPGCSPPPRLSIAKSGDRVTISWTGSGYRLETASALNGSASSGWMAMPGVSPVTLPATSSARFFRLVCR